MTIKGSGDSSSIRRENFQILGKLKKDETVSIDSEGKLHRIKKTKAVASNVFTQTLSPEIEKIAMQYARESMKQKIFHHVEEGPKHYNDLINKLSESNLITQKDKELLAFDWYDQRWRDLSAEGMHPTIAEGVITIEMTQDPNIPEKEKAIFRPESTTSGTGGSYFIKNRAGKKIGVFKPSDEEVAMPNNPEEFLRTSKPPRKGLIPGKGWEKEIAASKLNEHRNGIFRVPLTEKIVVPFPKRVGSSEIIMKTGSFQLFVQGKPLTAGLKSEIANLAKDQVQLLMIFDMVHENTDRITANLLYDVEKKELHLIDNGSCFSHSADYKQKDILEIETEVRFEWLGFPQANVGMDDLDEKALDEIFRSIDEDVSVLKKNNISEEAIRVMKLRKIVLQEGIKAGLTLRQIAILLETSYKTIRRTETEYISHTWIDEITIETCHTLAKQEPYEDEDFFAKFTEIFHSGLAEGKKVIEKMEKIIKKYE